MSGFQGRYTQGTHGFSMHRNPPFRSSGFGPSFVDEPELDEFDDNLQPTTQQVPLFSFSKAAGIGQDIVCMASANELMFLGQADGNVSIQRKGSRQTKQFRGIPNDGWRMLRMFLSSDADRILIVVQSEEGLCKVLHKFLKDDGPLEDLKLNMNITSVAWMPFIKTSGSSSTIALLAGTSENKILYIEIDRIVKAAKEVKRIKVPSHGTIGSAPNGISGLAVHVIGEPDLQSHFNKFFILVCTPTTIYVAAAQGSIVEPDFTDILAGLERSKAKEFARTDAPSSNIDDYQLSLYYPPRKNKPSAFAAMTTRGILYGPLALDHALGFQDKHIPFEKIDPAEKQDDMRLPHSVAVTKSHILLLFDTEFKAVSQISEEIVYQDQFRKSSTLKMIRFASDKSTGHVYAHAAKTVFQIRAENEDRDAWQLHLQNNDFDAAFESCSGDSEKQDQVLQAQAQFYFQQQKYSKAAELFANTNASFETVCLQFMDAQDENALRLYLSFKLQSIPKKHSTQRTVIATWLVELYLAALSELREQSSKDKDASEDAHQLQTEFHSFLEQEHKAGTLDKTTILELIASHGHQEDLIAFATLIEDHERVIQHLLHCRQYDDAVKILGEQATSQPKLVYRFAPILMQYKPEATAQMCMNHSKLEAHELIPAFVRAMQMSQDPHHTRASIIKYLESYVQQTEQQVEKAVHNYLLSLYVQSENEQELLNYITRNKTETDHFDLDYALRLCLQQKKQLACIAIYGCMKLYEEAVSVALKMNDIELAVQYTNECESLDLQRTLWLKICQYVIEEQRDTEKAIKLLGESKILKIEDILPFFPDFTKIDQFREQINASLEKYNQEITTLNQQMKNTTDSAEMIQDDIRELSHRYQVIPANLFCTSCKFHLLTRDFYMFPCMHGFHDDCLRKEARPYLSRTQQRKLDEFEQQLVSGSNSDVAQRKIENLVSGDCPECGDVIIDAIDIPFVPPGELRDYKRSWETGDNLISSDY